MESETRQTQVYDTHRSPYLDIFFGIRLTESYAQQIIVDVKIRSRIQ